MLRVKDFVRGPTSLFLSIKNLEWQRDESSATDRVDRLRWTGGIGVHLPLPLRQKRGSGFPLQADE